ncbi:MAG: host-nuclease inhibitor Gam family protein [Spirochaetia bacterium]
MITNLIEAEAALNQLRKIEIRQQCIQENCRKKREKWNDKISKILCKAQKKEEALLQQATDLYLQIEKYAHSHQELWLSKSLRLPSGVIGFRQRVHIEITENTASLLLELGHKNYVRIKQEPNRRKMLELKDKILKKVQAKRVIEDHFYISYTD